MTSHPPVAEPSRVIDDEDYDYYYYWSAAGAEFRIPRWLAEILDIPLVLRWELFMAGVCFGLVLAAVAVFIAAASAI